MEKHGYKPDSARSCCRKKRAEQPPLLKVSKSENVFKIGPDHPNETIGHVLLMEALVTTDQDFSTGFFAQLANASGGEVDGQRLNSMLSVVETMLVAQMAAVHTATMKFSA